MHRPSLSTLCVASIIPPAAALLARQVLDLHRAGYAAGDIATWVGISLAAGVVFAVGATWCASSRELVPCRPSTNPTRQRESL